MRQLIRIWFAFQLLRIAGYLIEVSERQTK